MLLFLIVTILCISVSYTERIGQVINRPGGPGSCKSDATINYRDVLMLKSDVQPWVAVQSTEGEF